MKTSIKFKNILIASLCLMNMLCFGQQMIFDQSFNIGSGFNAAVRANVLQPDGKIIVGGDFTSFDGVGIYRIARLNSNGTLDLSFNSFLGFDAVVRAIAIQTDGKILVGGEFTSYNGVNRNGIARLNTDGTIDNSFDAGLGSGSRVNSIAIQSNNQIIFGGAFFTGSIRRVNFDGSIDNSFNIGSGFNSHVNSVSIQQDEKIIVVGNYNSYGGVNFNGIIRLNSNASIDVSFNTGSGFGPLGSTPTYVWSSFIQSDGKILIGGYFGAYNGSTVYYLARLNVDGTLDPLLSSPGDARRAIQLNDGKILIGGYMTNVDGANSNYFAKLNADGSFNSPYQFNDVVYTISEQSNGRALVGGSFTNFNGLATNRFVRLINVSTTFSDSICTGDSYVWNGQNYTQPGQYTQLLTAQNGADSVVILNLSIVVNDQIYISPNTTFGNAPLNVAFANQTPNLTNYNFTWFFGDGTSQQSNAPFLSHIYTQDGYADVTVVAENLTTGCSSSQTFDDMIFVIGGVTCTHTATLNQSGPLSACAGNSVLLSCNTDPSFSYQWNRNGISVSGATSSSFYPTQSGSYTVTIYQNNCPVTSNGVSVTINPLPNIPTITSSGTIVPCSGGSMTLNAPSGFVNYLWNTGSTASSLVVSQSGNYSVTVTDNNGCSRTSDPFAVNASNMSPPQVCIVGVDSLTNENRVVWEKPLTFGIDSFYVYKESNVSNVYSKIGATDYNDLAVFLDANSNPAVQAYRYKISALDTCGIETNVGEFHKTIHLTINAGVGGAWNLIWSHYEGLTFGSYKIYRGTDPSNISLLTTIQSNLNSYSDLAPPVGPVYYQIEIVNPNNCDPTKIMNYSISRSNIVNNGVNGINTLTKSTVLVYPNPTSKDVTLEITSELLGKDYYLTDNTGRIILSGQFRALKETINLEQIASGVYFIKIDDNAHLIYKMVKN